MNFDSYVEQITTFESLQLVEPLLYSIFSDHWEARIRFTLNSSSIFIVVLVNFSHTFRQLYETLLGVLTCRVFLNLDQILIKFIWTLIEVPIKWS